MAGDGGSNSSPALPRKQRDKSPSGLLDEPLDSTFTRDRKAGFFSSFMKKKSSSSSASTSQLQHHLPMPPKRSSSCREMETQPHKKYEPTFAFGAPPPPQIDGLGFSPSHGEGNHVQSRCCGATFGQKFSASNSPAPSQVGSSSSWAGLAGFFTPRLIKKTLGIRTGKPSGTDEGGGGARPFPRSNSTSSMSAGLPDLERMALTLPRNRSKQPLERTASTSSQPENGANRPPDVVPKKLDEGTAQIRDRPKAKLLPRGVAASTGGTRAPGVGGEAEPDVRNREVQDDRPAWSSPSKMLVGPHNHKVPVLISPTLKPGQADPHIVGIDSQGNRFRLLADSASDRPRLMKPKCAPPPPPTLRSLQHSFSLDGTDESAGAGSDFNGDTIKRVGRGPGGARPCIPPPQAPTIPTASPSHSAATNKMANGGTTSTSSKLILRRTRQQVERVPLEKVSKEALLECAEYLSLALQSTEPSPNSQVLDAGHQLLDYCSGYVDCIPQMRNKFAFREAVGKLELSLQELRASSTGGGGVGQCPALDNLHSCIKEISDVVQR